MRHLDGTLHQGGARITYTDIIMKAAATVLTQMPRMNSYIDGTLKDDELHHNTDALAAMALSSEFGSEIFRCKYADDLSTLPKLIVIWRAAEKKRAFGRYPTDRSQTVADESLNYWLDDKCTVCSGRGAPIIINSPHLSAATCQACDGTTRRKLTVSPEIYDHVRDAVAELHNLERMAGAAAMRKLSEDMQ